MRLECRINKPYKYDLFFKLTWYKEFLIGEIVSLAAPVNMRKGWCCEVHHLGGNIKGGLKEPGVQYKGRSGRN